jgi:GTP diphosphokinase / guanosine-3',5'-bis(diphosphate) 3'-diphosphatase
MEAIMFETVRLVFKAFGSREGFLALISLQYGEASPEYHLIEDAYDFADYEFREVKRHSGDPYITHLRATAILVFLALWWRGINDPKLIAAALLHDLLEDFRERWSYERLAMRFGEVIAGYVAAVTKPDSALCAHDSAVRNQVYKAGIYLGSFRTTLMKLCDNVTNLVTLWHTPRAQQVRTLEMALLFYYPIAQERDIFPLLYRSVVLYAQVRHLASILKSKVIACTS